MRTYILLIAFTLHIGCSSTKDIPTKNVFTFMFDGQPYQIVSLNTSTGEGSNFLFSNRDGNSVRTASDLDQDGKMDVLIDKQITLEQANLIYSAGIIQARDEGNFRKRENQQTYEYQRADSLFTVRSFTMNDGSANNLFTIRTLSDRQESMFTDDGADGELDRRDKGTITLPEAANMYRFTLDKGIVNQRITLVGNMYKVGKSDNTSSFTSLMRSEN